MGAHDPVEIVIGSAQGAGSTMDDKGNSSLTESHSATAVANAGAGDVFDLMNGLVRLYQVGNSTSLGSFSFDSLAASHTWCSMMAGDCLYEVRAQVVPNASGGSDLLSSTLIASAPVPVPDADVLLMPRLGVLGFASAHRRQF